MRAVVQRVTQARVQVDGHVTGEIAHGLVILLGIHQQDTTSDAEYLVRKIAALRIFNDEAGKMNRSIVDCGGGLLVVSQFTLYGDCRKGTRPSFDQAARPEVARVLYEHFVTLAQNSGLPVQTGVFQAAMQVTLVNDGPVTLVVNPGKLTSAE